MRCLLFCAFCCAVYLPTIAVAADESPKVKAPWNELVPGIRFTRVTRETPPLVAHVVSVDLRKAHLEVLVTPGEAVTGGEIGARSTTEALEEFSCRVAINGAVFKPRASERGDAVEILGIAVSKGKKYSDANQYHALVFRRGERPRIEKPPFREKRIEHAISGYYTVLSEGKPVGASGERHPRTLVGLNKRRDTLFLVVIDGRLPTYSAGATLQEASALLVSLGADSGLNLDGGGSSSLVLRKGDGSVTRLNIPSAGLERRVANHLCIRDKKSKK